MGSRRFEDFKPALAMVGLQIIYAALALMGKAALSEGLNPVVLVVYRQGVATLALAPMAYYTRRRSGSQVVLGIKSFCLLFVAALLGITMSQTLYFLGLEYGSASLVSAMINLIPAVTFLMAAPLGCVLLNKQINFSFMSSRMEKLSLSSRGIAKIGGTVLCVGGAITISLLKGPKLLGRVLLHTSDPSHSFQSASRNWLLSCLLLLGCSCCWSMFLILQVPLSKFSSDPITLSTWMCFLALLQSAILAFFIERDSNAWKLEGSLEIIYCIYSGILGTGVAICLQAWCISKRGPLFSATFYPLCTVITTILGVIILHEVLYAGSLAGGIAVVGGLYIVLWGKAEDYVHTKKSEELQGPVLLENHAPETDVEEPLLVER
ncbi:hypothetical protein Taro_033822 [Colocasia esculenta]|uniref:WAT1-related protein n=1 Tax=Colocasia esculenta TaxID=4460 RepID=A0A843W836_COLES|nr:hypothetical protein [Colocasia esculenta]